MTTFLSEFGVSWEFSWGSCAKASLIILGCICCSSPCFQEKSNDRGSVDSLSEIPTRVLVPAAITGSLAGGTAPSGDVGFAGTGVAWDSGFAGARRFSTGRSVSSGAGVETGWASDAPGEGVGSGAGLPEAGDEPPRWRMGLSSATVTGVGVASAFFAAEAGCHFPSAVQPLLFALLRMVT